ncbi:MULTISPECIES: VIT1/CCC1 transporter family protein [Crateriforma]|uniref:VIT family protein n=1 Tax=Crateriforma conspicua TaxID=2527996 RepID=A0A5C6FY30_9PLAN|nr:MULTISPECIES: VIT1/CCC1 transporter family protein [Crateriforma]TWU67254.1 VIT family protein [Crateriforma conspicua]
MNQPPAKPSLSPEHLAATHTSELIGKRLRAGHKPDYLPDFIYGAIDGTVTTFAVVSGVAGAELSSTIVIILGLANLIGDGFSMAASNYMGTRVEGQLRDRARIREGLEIDAYPDGEREEIRQIYAQKGFTGNDLDRAVDVITSDRQRWIDTMVAEEMGISLTYRSPWIAGLTTMVAFLIVGLIPLLPFVAVWLTPLELSAPYVVSSVMTGCAFFLVGAIKSRFVEQWWVWSGLETLVLGGSAAVLAYIVGWALRGIAV